VSRSRVVKDENAVSLPAAVDHVVIRQPRRKQVFLIDDSSVSSRVVTRKLESAGYSVQTAYNGLLALDMIKKEPDSFGVIIADVVMPVMVR
jgi:CheY-like chemotaxis protein